MNLIIKDIDSEHFSELDALTFNRFESIQAGTAINLVLREDTDSGNTIFFDVKYRHSELVFKTPNRKDAMAIREARLERCGDFKKVRILFSQFYQTTTLKGLAIEGTVKKL